MSSKTMHSFLIISKDKDKASLYITDFLKKKEIFPIDISQQAYEKAVGIEDVRNIQKSILLKPFKGKTKAVVIGIYTDISIEAQNALLKVLEEPPTNTIIAISAPKKELLLPTIISRCSIIELKEEEVSLTNEDVLNLNNVVDILFNGKVGDKLKAAQDISKNRDEAVLWLEKMAAFVRTKLTEDQNGSDYPNLLKSLQKTYKTIKNTNVNQRIALEDLFLSF